MVEHTASAATAALVTAHLAWMRWRNLSPDTIEQRRRTLRRIARFYPDRSVADLTAPELLAFRDRLTRAGQPLAVQSQAAELAHLRGWYRWLVIEEYRIDDPMIKVPRPKLPRGIPHPMPEPDLARAIDHAEPTRLLPWITLGAYAGLRACEMAPLRADDLWWTAEPPLIVIRKAKGGDEEAVALAPVLEPILRALPSRGWLFPYRDGKLGPVKPWTVSQLSNNYLHSLGIWHTLHSLRHRFGTQVLRVSGGNLRQTQELMRHKSITSTVRYTAVDQGVAAGIVAALPVAG